MRYDLESFNAENVLKISNNTFFGYQEIMQEVYSEAYKGRESCKITPFKLSLSVDDYRFFKKIMNKTKINLEKKGFEVNLIERNHFSPYYIISWGNARIKTEIP